jgi:D-serine deaminase-like pyridoxal phosphate-dependent protein
VRAGAAGACTAKLGEAEVFAAHDVRGLLVTTAIVGEAKAARAAALAPAPDTIVVADDVHQSGCSIARPAMPACACAWPWISTSAAPASHPARRTRRRAGDCRRTASRVRRPPGLRRHRLATFGAEARRARSTATMGEAVATRSLLERTAPCPMVSAGSTALPRGRDRRLTELQPGSFIFMDTDYLRIGGPDGEAAYDDFRPALSVVTTVVSVHGDEAIVDGGYKSFATDRPFAPLPVDRPDLVYGWAGDEHGRLDMRRATRRLAVGDRLEFRAPHCDPTVNLYDEIHALRGDDVEAVWTIAARGKSQ